jgi:hypothetical protein
MNLPALKGGVSCLRYKLDEVQSARKLFTVGFNTMNSKRYKKSTALKLARESVQKVLNPTANKTNDPF